MTDQNKKSQTDDSGKTNDPGRPSQAEGERDPGSQPEANIPQPSQAEGERETVEQDLRRRERGGKKQ